MYAIGKSITTGSGVCPVPICTPSPLLQAAIAILANDNTTILVSILAVPSFICCDSLNMALTLGTVAGYVAIGLAYR